MDPETGVLVVQNAAGKSVVLGLLKCGRIWFCPVCSAVIRHRRSEEITRAVVEWIKRGGHCYLVTFTAKHAHADRLADLMDALQGTRKNEALGIKRTPGAYQRLITGGTWAGRPDRIAEGDDDETRTKKLGIRNRIGYIGMIRATEITVGLVNGWHPHIHSIVFIGENGTPGKMAVREWQDHWRQTWTNALRQINPDYKPSQKHGVDFKRLKTVQDAQDMGKYIAKLQEGSKSINPANEVARGDLKEGRNGNMTPFQVLYRIADMLGGVREEDADGKGTLKWCLGAWHEYERAASGRRAIEWTRYLRPMLGIEGDDSHEGDLDKLFEDETEGGSFRGGVAVTETGWNGVTRRALDYAAVMAVEGTDANTEPGAVTERVREVLAIADVAAEVRELTAAEVSETYEAQQANLARRREEAAARRKREREKEEQEHVELDRAAVKERALRALRNRNLVQEES